jgi:hypothetical protein
MASNITYSTIDENYPVAGVDNDSQGFRDNFNIVKTALTTTSTEITDLQAGSCKVNAANNFAGNTISYANFLANKESTNTANSTGVSANLSLSWSQANVFVIKATNDITLTFSDFPIDGYGKMKLFLTADGSARTISLVGPNGSTILTDGNAAWTNDTLIIGPTAFRIMVEISTYDSVTFFARYIGAFA